MANFYGHFSTSVVLGAAYGAAGAWYGHYDWGVVFLASGLTIMGGLTPDLDSDSGRPIRERFGLAGFIFPLCLIPRLRRSGLSLEQALSVLVGSYLFIRYGLSEILKKLSVHRGMFHSLPAMAIAGLIVFLLSQNPRVPVRAYLAAGTMLGFLSHLVLDEVCAVDLNGVVPRLNAFAGSAVKLTSKSWTATGITYMILFALGYAAWITTDPATRPPGGGAGGRTPVTLPALKSLPG